MAKIAICIIVISAISSACFIKNWGSVPENKQRAGAHWVQP